MKAVLKYCFWLSADGTFCLILLKILRSLFFEDLVHIFQRQLSAADYIIHGITRRVHVRYLLSYQQGLRFLPSRGFPIRLILQHYKL